jgi:hypothetical protein
LFWFGLFLFFFGYHNERSTWLKCFPALSLNVGKGNFGSQNVMFLPGTSEEQVIKLDWDFTLSLWVLMYVIGCQSSGDHHGGEKKQDCWSGRVIILN